MATALIRGMLNAGVCGADDVIAGDPIEARRLEFASATGVKTTGHNVEVFIAANLVLAVKPQSMSEVLAELRGAVTSDHFVVSIAAGISIATMREALGAKPRLARVMPNTPALVGCGASAYSLDPSATSEDAGRLHRLLSAVGTCFEVPERLLDAVTGLSGSGPAFGYQVIDALSDGGVRMGLPREVATILAAQTILGAAKMVLETGQHPGVLKDQVCSPGGTTIAGLHALERGGLRAALMDAVEAATRRSAELSARAPAPKSTE